MITEIFRTLSNHIYGFKTVARFLCLLLISCLFISNYSVIANATSNIQLNSGAAPFPNTTDQTLQSANAAWQQLVDSTSQYSPDVQHQVEQSVAGAVVAWNSWVAQGNSGGLGLPNFPWDSVDIYANNNAVYNAIVGLWSVGGQYPAVASALQNYVSPPATPLPFQTPTTLAQAQMNLDWQNAMNNVNTLPADQQQQAQQNLWNALTAAQSGGFDSSAFCTAVDPQNNCNNNAYGALAQDLAGANDNGATLNSLANSIHANNLLPQANTQPIPTAPPIPPPADPPTDAPTDPPTVPSDVQPVGSSAPIPPSFPSMSGNYNVDQTTNPVSITLCEVVALLTGTAGKAIATIAIIFLCIGLFVGKLSWGLAVAMALGIGGIFGAPQIVNYIAPNNAQDCATLLKVPDAIGPAADPSGKPVG